MAKKQFKAESKRLLDLMINSIYTHKEIFLRELISNASDAMDKLYFISLTDPNVGLSREDFSIRIERDRDARTLRIKDNGCGMTAKELEDNLGTIARSGTLTFKKDHDLKDDIDIIGQFGVGFYSAFMVAGKVEVLSRAYGSDEANLWTSTGEDGYTIVPAEKAEPGTEITLYLKDDTDDEKYSRFLEEYTIRDLVKKYSDYVRYPIRMLCTHSRKVESSEKDKEPTWESYEEEETLNSRIPLWKKPKEDVTDEQLNRFYQDKFHDYDDPLLTIRTSAEGAVSYTGLMFIPKHTPFDYYSKEYQRGLQLYANGVMIMEKCEDLLPDFFGFVHGLVDSADLSLNISREMLQHDRQLKLIAQNLKKKIKSELVRMMENDRPKYEEFWKSFGLPLKYGLYAGYGANKEFLQDLVLFHSAKENKLVSLKEYVDAMPEDQKCIYYACGETIDRVMKLPQTESIRDKGYDILCMTDDVDEFAVRIMEKYMEKEFKSVAEGDLDLVTEDEKKARDEQSKNCEPLLSAMKQALGDKVKQVRLSSRLKDSPVCLASEGPLSIEMEKVLNAMPMAGDKIKAERILEINPEHPVFKTLSALDPSDDRISKFAALLYDQALLIEGLPIEDPVAFSNSVCELMK